MIKEINEILFFVLVVAAVSFPGHIEARSQNQPHPHLFFDRREMETLRTRVLQNPRLNRIWQQFKTERVDSSFQLTVKEGGFSLDEGRDYGDAISDMALAYIVLGDSKYADKAIGLMTDLADESTWGQPLSVAHISIGFAFGWDVLYDTFTSDEKDVIRNAIRSFADNRVSNDVYANVNWTTSAGEGLVGLAFQLDGDASFNDFVQRLLENAKQNYKDDARSVLWAHGTDGFPHEGLGYWRKYIHVGLFLYALRFNEPGNNWFNLGEQYPGCEFLENTAYPRIYADVQHEDLATLTWADSRQVRSKSSYGPFGGMGVMALVASEYKNGHALNFMDYLINEAGYRFNAEDWATFIFYDDRDIPFQSYRNLPLSRYWPDLEAAIFRSGWDSNDMIFYMRSGSPGGHGRRIKNLPHGGHDHPDANGFVLLYNGDYLAAEDAARPSFGPDKETKITYGHNTFLVDGMGQRGDKTEDVVTTGANIDYIDAEHIGYLLGDATDAYSDIDKFYRYVIYKKHKYFIIVDELQDNARHKYEFLLGTDHNHSISSDGNHIFRINPLNGSACLPVIFVEPQDIESIINKDRPYAISSSYVDLLRVWPKQEHFKVTFFTLIYPKKSGEPDPSYTKIYENGLSGIVVDGNEYYLYNKNNSNYVYQNITTDAKLCYFKDGGREFEYLAAGSKEFSFDGQIGFQSDQPVVVAFKGLAGKIRLGKNLGNSTPATVTLFYPDIIDILVDDHRASIVDTAPGWATINLSPKQYTIGPPDAKYTMTDNYKIIIKTTGSTQSSQAISLRPNYPNPFAVETTIVYSLLEDARVHLSIYNLNGQLVRTLVNQMQAAGDKKVNWDGMDDLNHKVSAGVYFVNLQIGDMKTARKIILH